MQELDLEELDQAVSKIMSGGKSKTKADDKPADDKPADEPKAPAATKTKADEEDNSVPVNIKRQALEIAPRKRGIAMDIVQNKPNGAAPPSSKPAREAPTLQPTGADVAPEPPAPRETESQPKTPEVSDDTLASLDMQSDGVHKSDAEQSDGTPKPDFPDPLDVHGFKDDDEAKKRADEDDEPAKDDGAEGPTLQHETAVVAPPDGFEAEMKAEKAEEDAKEAAAEEEPTSPFVNTKVEKRPLGAFTDNSPAAPPIGPPAPEEEKDEDKIMEHGDGSKLETQAKDSASIPVQETPKELSPEVVAVESSEPEFTTNQAEAEEDEGGDMNELRQMSIPQQYKAEAKSPSEVDRPVFDTKEYHAPINPSATVIHKPSRAGLIVTIIFILLMVVAAALAYFAITGTVDVTRWL